VALRPVTFADLAAEVLVVQLTWVEFSLFAVLIGVLSFAITYLLMRHSNLTRLHSAQLEAAVEKTRNELQDACFKRLSLEQHLNLQSEWAWFKKKEFLVIRERYCFDALPITPWSEQKRPISEKLDDEAIKRFARAASFLAAPVADKVRIFANIFRGTRKVTSAAKAGK